MCRSLNADFALLVHIEVDITYIYLMQDLGQRMIHQVLAFSLQILHSTWTESLLKLIGSSFVPDLLSLKRSSRQTGKTGRK
jgi:hypothetical protein